MAVLRPPVNALNPPAGRPPGFDPWHVAAKGIEDRHGFSGIATANNFINLVTGTVGAVTGATQTTVINKNGLATRWPTEALNTYYNFPGTLTTDLVATMAIIATFESAPTRAYLWTDTSSNGGFRLDAQGFVMNFVLAVAHGLTVPTNVPFFYAASKTPTAVNFVILNLTTGNLQTAVVANASTALIPGGAFQCVGSFTGNETVVGTTSAAMWAPVALSISELRAWCADPWAFWYPRRKMHALTPSVDWPPAGATGAPTSVKSTLRF